MIQKKTLPIPLKFHTLIKYEAIKSGKTITAYLNDIADEVADRNITFQTYIQGKSNEKKKFIPRF